MVCQGTDESLTGQQKSALKGSKKKGGVSVTLIRDKSASDKPVSAYGEKSYKYIHTLVALIFIGPPPGANYTVHHKDGNLNNNNVSNLCWINKNATKIATVEMAINIEKIARQERTLEIYKNSVGEYREGKIGMYYLRDIVLKCIPNLPEEHHAGAVQFCKDISQYCLLQKQEWELMFTSKVIRTP